MIWRRAYEPDVMALEECKGETYVAADAALLCGERAEDLAGGGGERGKGAEGAETKPEQEDVEHEEGSVRRGRVHCVERWVRSADNGLKRRADAGMKGLSRHGEMFA